MPAAVRRQRSPVPAGPMLHLPRARTHTRGSPPPAAPRTEPCENPEQCLGLAKRHHSPGPPGLPAPPSCPGSRRL